MRWRINLSTTPPGGFKFKVPETGQWIPDPKTFGSDSFFGFGDLSDAVRRHYKGNKLMIPGDLDQRMIDQLCDRLPSGYCRNDDSRILAMAEYLKQAFVVVKEGTQVLLDWQVRYGGRMVDQSLAESRAAVCSQCPLNGPPQGCATCHGGMGALRALVNKFVGDRKTTLDDKLQACYVCGCELRVKIWLERELLMKHLSPEHLARFPKKDQWPAFPGCWLVTEQANETTQK